jgi:hypothetical protein
MIYKHDNDGKASVQLSSFQRSAIHDMQLDIVSKKLRLVGNCCLCGNCHSENDLLIAQKDRYGIAVNNILCSKCGLIRSGEVFDGASNSIFYAKYYRNIYVGEEGPSESFFIGQTETGSFFLKLVRQCCLWDDIRSVVEIGCGAGGILYPFLLHARQCKGFDFDERFLKLGRAHGLTLVQGDYKDTLEDGTVDLLILSHVMEHFVEPIREMRIITGKITCGGYLLVEVPSVFCIRQMYYNPILYFQNAHIFNFYGAYLRVFFNKLGLEVVYGDERCTFLLRKPATWQDREISDVYDEQLGRYPAIVFRYLRYSYIMDRLWLNPWKLVNKTACVLEMFHIRKPLRRFINFLQSRNAQEERL